MKTKNSVSAVASVAKGILLVSLLSISSSFAIVGENEEESTKRYGPPLNVDLGKGEADYSCAYRYAPGIMMLAFYNSKGSSTSEIYSKDDKTKFTDEERDDILDQNLSRWKLSGFTFYRWVALVGAKPQPMWALISVHGRYKDVTAEQIRGYTQDEIGVLLNNVGTNLWAFWGDSGHRTFIVQRRPL